MPALLLWLGLGSWAAGCGQKGPLKMPAGSAATTAATASAPAASAASAAAR